MVNTVNSHIVCGGTMISYVFSGRNLSSAIQYFLFFNWRLEQTSNSCYSLVLVSFANQRLQIMEFLFALVNN